MTSDLREDAGMPVNLKGAYVDSIMKNGPVGSTTDQYSKVAFRFLVINMTSEEKYVEGYVSSL